MGWPAFNRNNRSIWKSLDTKSLVTARKLVATLLCSW